MSHFRAGIEGGGGESNPVDETCEVGVSFALTVHVSSDDEGELVVLQFTLVTCGSDELSVEVEAGFSAVIDSGDLVPRVDIEERRI